MILISIFFKASNAKLEDSIKIFPKLSMVFIQEKLNANDVAGIPNTTKNIRAPTLPIDDDR